MRTGTRKAVLAIAALLVVAVACGVVFFVAPLACQSAGERRLVGAWELERVAPEAAAAPAAPDATGLPPRAPAAPTGGPGTADGRDAEVQRFLKGWTKALGQWAALASPDVRVEFESNGTYTEAMGFSGRRQVVTGRWEAVQGGDDRVVVRLYGADGDRSRSQELTISFEGDDVMLYPSAAGAPIRMRRQRD